MKEILIISLLGIVVLALDVLKMRKLVLPVILLGLLGLVGVSIADWGMNETPFAQYGGMLTFDNTALSFTAVFGTSYGLCLPAIRIHPEHRNAPTFSRWYSSACAEQLC
jgi:hypothetical protein